MNDVMEARAGIIDAEWKDEGDGYHSMTGTASGILMSVPVAYVAIPESHPLAGKDYDELPEGGPDVNGGLTFAQRNVFGWDYGHAYNRFTPEQDTESALEYFRSREKP